MIKMLLGGMIDEKFLDLNSVWATEIKDWTLMIIISEIDSNNDTKP